MTQRVKIVPIYTTRGDTGGYLVFPYIFNSQGEWIGWVEPNRNVYSVHGHYAGYLTLEPRILRKRELAGHPVRRRPPPAPPSIRAPARTPLAPHMQELMMGDMDVLDEAPDLLPPVDYGELKDDAE
jgi:hypothetical protein